MPAAEHVQRQIAVAVVVAAEEPPRLAAVHGVVGRVHVQHDLRRRRRRLQTVQRALARQRLAAVRLLPPPAPSPPRRAAGGQDFYLVSDYDPRRDTEDLVSAAMARAAAENKRVLLVLGGDWCGWCKVLENEIDQSEELIDLLDRNYVVAKVYCDAGSPGIRFKPRSNSGTALRSSASVRRRTPTS